MPISIPKILKLFLKFLGTSPFTAISGIGALALSASNAFGAVTTPITASTPTITPVPRIDAENLSAPTNEKLTKPTAKIFEVQRFSELKNADSNLKVLNVSKTATSPSFIVGGGDEDSSFDIDTIHKNNLTNVKTDNSKALNFFFIYFKLLCLFDLVL